ncbi:MAG: ArdC-like ssDNA-binding domain-containing protein [Prevotella sp.]
MMKNGTENNAKSQSEKAVDLFTGMMIERMEAMKSEDWKKGWIAGNTVGGLPQNVTGRNYSGSNSFFLELNTALKGYKTPVYLTFIQARDLKAHILQGEKSMPVLYWDVVVHDRNGRKVDYDDFKQMPKDQQSMMNVIPFLRAYSVFNLEQTNLPEVNPNKYQSLLKRFTLPEIRDTNGMFSNAALDKMFERQSWICPIHCDKPSGSAFYRPSSDEIVLPMKAQFNKGNSNEEIYKDGMEFYSTALHEMAHSTGTVQRLNRLSGDKFGDPKYAKEELVAELTSAMIGNSMGFDKRILNNNAAYLDNWIGALKENSKFIVSVMADVNKAANMVLEKIDEQKLALGEPPLLEKNRSKSMSFEIASTDEEVPFKDASIFKLKNGNYAVRASYNGVDLGIKKIESNVATLYFSLDRTEDKQRLLTQTLNKNFANVLPKIGISKEQPLKIG